MRNIELRNAVARGAFSWARKGDWNYLADHIERGGVITAEIRGFLVAVLRRKLRRPNNRAPSVQKDMDRRNRVLLFLSATASGMSREKAKGEAALKAGVDRRTIDRDIKEYESNVRRDLKRAEDERGAGRVSMPWKIRIGYQISSTALSQHFLS
jgi:hypothetical protein